MQTAHLWKQAGRISVWRYTENAGNYPGWHLTADPAGFSRLLLQRWQLGRAYFRFGKLSFRKRPHAVAELMSFWMTLKKGSG
jgi:hypothetical protein